MESSLSDIKRERYPFTIFRIVVPFFASGQIHDARMNRFNRQHDLLERLIKENQKAGLSPERYARNAERIKALMNSAY